MRLQRFDHGASCRSEYRNEEGQRSTAYTEYRFSSSKETHAQSCACNDQGDRGRPFYENQLGSHGAYLCRFEVGFNPAGSPGRRDENTKLERTPEKFPTRPLVECARKTSSSLFSKRPIKENLAAPARAVGSDLSRIGFPTNFVTHFRRILP